nr:cys-based protein tyrosine phosphatase [Oceanusvirus sp.]
MAFSCEACGRSYSTKSNLGLHYERQPLCLKWIREVDDRMKHVVTGEIEIRSERAATRSEACEACGKEFSTDSNLLRHVKASPTCQKWIVYRDVARINFTSREWLQNNEGAGEAGEAGGVAGIDQNPDMALSCGKPDSSVHRLGWNVYLSDKHAPIDGNDFGMVVMILPDSSCVPPSLPEGIDREVLHYRGHQPSLDFPSFDRAIDRIEEREAAGENVLVFCNSGYQRTIPFLCRYMMRRDPKLYDDVEKTLYEIGSIVNPDVFVDDPYIDMDGSGTAQSQRQAWDRQQAFLESVRSLGRL